MEEGAAWQQRREVAVRASLSWYRDVFHAHRIPTRIEGGLWNALADPPRWHSVAKTLRPHVPVGHVLAAVERFDACSVADSYADLDLAPHGFRRLFRATWLHRPARAQPASGWPDGWGVVADEDDLSRWNAAHDTTGVLVPALLTHPRFTFLVRRSGDDIVAGAVLHRAGDAVELSNTWPQGDQAREVLAALACAEALHPGLAVVGYCAEDTVSVFTGAGFGPVGPHVVWVRGG